MEEQAQPPSAPTETQPVTQQPLRPHRGGVVLALGILGLVVCFILGIIAWVMGNKDLREIDAGTMDPSGRGLTKAGKICGMANGGNLRGYQRCHVAIRHTRRDED